MKSSMHSVTSFSLFIIILVAFLFIASGFILKSFLCDWEGFSIGGAYAQGVEVEEGEADDSSEFDMSAMDDDANIVFLHKDLGEEIWDAGLSDWIKKYNKENDKGYKIYEKEFPKNPSDKFKNMPCDYWNIWVNHEGDEEYKDCPTLEILAKRYHVIMFKHSMDASHLEKHEGEAVVKTRTQTIENYKAQYEVLKKKMHQFAGNRFIIWTLSALTEDETDEENAKRIQEFNKWMKTDWDEQGDNIFVWDFYSKQTDGGLYFKDEYIKSLKRLKFQKEFKEKCLNSLGGRVIQVLQGKDYSTGGKREAKIIFLHHSTGSNIWKGGVEVCITKYNIANKTKYDIKERAFPKSSPYGWKNYPYDYWNIWVKNAGKEQFMEEDTLEILTKEYDVIVFKHCYPVSKIVEDEGDGDVESDVKSIQNYKLQYDALKKKMKEFPDTTFLVWTGAALNRTATNKQEAERAKEFFDWVKKTWDEKGDNIFIWDFWQLETGGGLYLKDENSAGSGNSHPGKEFSSKAAPLFAQRIINILQSKGDETSSTGE